MQEITSHQLYGGGGRQKDWQESMMMELQRQHQQNNINPTFDFQKRADLSLQLRALGQGLPYVPVPFLRSNGFSVILWRALRWKQQVATHAPFFMSLLCIHPEVDATLQGTDGL